MNDELERTWKETVMAYSRYCPGISVEGLMKTTELLSLDTRCAGWGRYRCAGLLGSFTELCLCFFINSSENTAE
jgi:hypothetical protein